VQLVVSWLIIPIDPPPDQTRSDQQPSTSPPPFCLADAPSRYHRTFHAHLGPLDNISLRREGILHGWARGRLLAARGGRGTGRGPRLQFILQNFTEVTATEGFMALSKESILARAPAAAVGPLRCHHGTGGRTPRSPEVQRVQRVPSEPPMPMPTIQDPTQLPTPNSTANSTTDARDKHSVGGWDRRGARRGPPEVRGAVQPLLREAHPDAPPRPEAGPSRDPLGPRTPPHPPRSWVVTLEVVGWISGKLLSNNVHTVMDKRGDHQFRGTAPGSCRKGQVFF